MKNIIVILMAMPMLCSAQKKAVTQDGDTIIINDNYTWSYPQEEAIDYGCSLVKEEKDIVSGKTSITGDPITLSQDGKSGIIIRTSKLSKSITLSFYPFGASNCIDKGETAYILFTDGSRMELKSQSNFNCDNRYTIFMWNDMKATKKMIKELSEKEATVIRVYTEKGYVQESLSSDQASQLRTIIECLNQK
jgi:hypothetical protein